MTAQLLACHRAAAFREYLFPLFVSVRGHPVLLCHTSPGVHGHSHMPGRHGSATRISNPQCLCRGQQQGSGATFVEPNPHTGSI